MKIYTDFTKRFKNFVRVIVCIVILSLIKDSYIFAQGGTRPIRPPIQAPHVVRPPKDSYSLFDYINSIPEEYAIVKDSHEAGQKTIIHIQDAHAHLEAQRNSIEILKRLCNGRLSMDLIALEGAKGDINTLKFATYPDKKIRASVFGRYLEKGFITGAEYFAIVENPDAVLYGVDDKELYQQNMNHFQKAHRIKRKIQKYVDRVRAILVDLGYHVFTNEQKELLKIEKSYRSSDTPFMEFCEYVLSKAKEEEIELDSFQTIVNLMKASEIEDTIDFKQISNEREKVHNILSEKLTKEDKKDFLRLNLDYRLGIIDANTFYSRYKSFCELSKIDMSLYPNLSGYIKVTELWGNSDKDIFMDQLEELLIEVKSNIFVTPDQYAIDDHLRKLRILDKFTSLQVTRYELNYFRKKKDEFKAEVFLELINRMVKKYNLSYRIDPKISRMDDHIKVIEDFYNVAMDRDEVIVENTINEMDLRDVNCGVLITGGFHTEGITKLCREKKISYIIVAPRIKYVNADTPYLSIMMQEFSKFDQLLSTIGQRLIPPIATAVEHLTPLGKDLANILNQGVIQGIVTDTFIEHTLNKMFGRLRSSRQDLIETSEFIETDFKEEMEEAFNEWKWFYLQKTERELSEDLLSVDKMVLDDLKIENIDGIKVILYLSFLKEKERIAITIYPEETEYKPKDLPSETDDNVLEEVLPDKTKHSNFAYYIEDVKNQSIFFCLV